MIGRDAELAVLVTALDAVAAGDGALLVVEGPAGIGKTTLLDATAARARHRGITVLRARGNPLERDFPFGIARQLFAPLQTGPSWPDLCRGPAALADRVLGAVPPPAGAADATAAAAHGLFCLTANQAAARRTVLCVDDLHWADLPSLRWLVGVARRVDDLGVALVAAVRTGVPSEDPGVLGELLAGASVRLGPLPPGPAAALVRAALPTAGPAFADACHQAAAGNPFLLGALLAQLAGGPMTPDAVAAAGTPGPERVGRWVDQQLRTLPDGCAELARTLAVLGPAPQPRHAAALAGLDLDRAAVLADTLRAAGILAPTETLALAHPIVATALHDGLGPGERGVRHARAARLLAADGGDPARAAPHLLRAAPAGDPAAVALLRAAAERSTARGAPEAAATFLRRALAEPPGDPEVDAAIRLDLALALAAERRPGATELAREVVARIHAPAARADAALRCGRGLALTGDGAAAIELYRMVLDDPAGVPEPALARLEAELVAAAWTDRRTLPLLRAALRRPRTAVPLWRVNAATAAVFAGGTAADCHALLDPVLDDDLLAAEPDSLLPTVATIGLILVEDLDRVRAMCRAAVVAAEERGWPSTAAHGRFLLAHALLAAGEVGPAAAEAGAAVAFKLRGATPAGALQWALAPLVDALVEAGRPAEAEAALAEARELPPDAVSTPMVLQSRARLRLVQGRPREALEDLREAGVRWAAAEVVHPGLVTWRADAVAPLLALGERTEAARLVREHAELAERAGTAGPRAAALRAAALLDRGGRIDLLRAAVRETAGSPARLAYAYALFDLGCALRRANQRTEAREPLRAALDIAAAGGAQRLAGRARDELHAAGARPRRDAVRGPDALTDGEQRVADLAARGLTNREIAERLTVSRRTVETHLAHAYQKLRIHSRAAPTAARCRRRASDRGTARRRARHSSPG
ncbi:ATP-binding protein [Asanoa siamensis]|uniref:HTH luxR-type domain-containing protein n=1 Tax=Asanoa siamensis TaxID=926357 RepID=A0ABQ4CZF6_9ACTN|nr:LuxR family transcriptional regulator [Asanoa siamensis]GIF76678.1 hypothetical protein Asi02nite_61960 [Asanoa siamensis]